MTATERFLLTLGIFIGFLSGVALSVWMGWLS